ncbi:MAG: C25 family cysteine peptidase [Candidatus Erginobacter occultus]|nr:C25 family cysteine peptidase [Candidatus Erginobacter occultus]
MKKRFIITVVMALTLLLPCLRAGVVINEVFYDPPGDDKTAENREFVELYNNGPDPAYIGYMLLQTAGPRWKTTYVIEPRTIIPAYSYLLIAEGETCGVTPDLVAGLALPNGNYDAYYDGQWHSFTKSVVGVRLISGNRAFIYDCLLYNDGELGNANNLETDGAAVDGFYPDVPSGYSISRVTAGYDSNYLSDWKTLTDPTPTARGPLLDSDGDGLLDVIENHIGSNPQNPDSDGDGLLDGEEMRSGYLGIGPNETDPRDPDTDGDGLWDGLEVNTYSSNPRKPDTDGDGLLDGEEVYVYGTSPTNPDSDFDGYPDGWEVTYGTDPAAPASRPGVVINEVYYDNPGSDDRMEYLTFYNPEFYDVDISYFRVESAGPSFRRNLTFPAGTVIPAGCFFLVGEEDAVDMNGNPPDLISWLDLQNADQNDPDAYYYGKESPADGVRLTGPKGEGPAIAIDTVLWGSPNSNNLPGDAADPATADELIPDVPPGRALRRRIVGYDTNHKSDWAEVAPVKASSFSGQDPDGDGLTNYEEASLGTAALNPDTDGDGVADWDEIWHGYDPLDPDSVPLSVPDAAIRNFPIRSGDFNGDGSPDIAIFRPATGLWAVKNLTRVYFGTSGDIPQPGDYDGDGTTDITIFRPAGGLWAVRNLTRVYFGNQNDLPVSAEYNGDGTDDIGTFRPSTGLWAIRNLTRIYFGTSGDIPVPAEYPPTSRETIAIFRPSTGLWAVRGHTRVYFGRALDMPVPKSCPGSGDIQAIFRQRSGLWAVRLFPRIYYGTLGDLPVAAKWASQKNVGIFRPASGLWSIRNHTRTYFGKAHDMPMPMLYRGIDSDCDGLPDWWEEQYFGDLSQCPQDNPDGDGCTNLEEYTAGTDPTEVDCGSSPIPSPTPIMAPTPSVIPTLSPTPIPTVTPSDLIYSFSLNLNPGWSVEGDWAFGQPTGEGGDEFGNPDPSSGYTGDYVYGYNLEGDFTNSMPCSYYLTTSPLNCSGRTNIHLKFWRWLNIERNLYDHASIQVSTDGSSWIAIWENPGDAWTMDSQWHQVDYDLSGITNGHSLLYIRWGMGPTNEWVPASGWNIDDIEIRGIRITPTPKPTITPIPTASVSPTPEYVAPVFPPAGSSEDSVPYIIITNEAFKNAEVYPNFQTLIFYRLAQGMRGGIITVEEIDNEYDGIRPDAGVDLQTKIREFVYDAYYYWGTEYVLLGGNSAVIPPRLFYTWCGCPEFCEFPADMYYGCMDDVTFDYNADGRYAEPGVDDPEIDKGYEVYIGRMLVRPDLPQQASNLIQKTVTYENATSGYLEDVYLLAPWADYASMTAEVVVECGQLHYGYSGSYTTQGFVTNSYFNVLTYYCPYGDSTYNYNTEMLNNINAGAHLINHIGHSTAIGMHGKAWQIFSNPDEPFFAYTQGCDAGQFKDNMEGPEHLLLRSMETPFGCFAAVANSSKGLQGVHSHYNREFWDAMIGENINTLGQMLADSKFDNIGRSSYNSCPHYNQNLFGDPAITLHTESP